MNGALSQGVFIPRQIPTEVQDTAMSTRPAISYVIANEDTLLTTPDVLQKLNLERGQAVNDEQAFEIVSMNALTFCSASEDPVVSDFLQSDVFAFEKLAS